MKKFVKENWFKLAISLVLLMFAISGAYYLVYLPFKKNYDFNKCLSNSADNLLRQQIEINNNIDALEKSKKEASTEADNKLAEFLKNNPEPPKDAGYQTTLDRYLQQKGSSNTADYDDLYNRFKSISSGKHYQWVQQKDSIFESVNSMGRQIGELEKKRDNVIEAKKKANDDACFKRYK